MMGDQLQDVRERLGKERFSGILALSFIDAFLGAVSGILFPVPLFSFSSGEGEYPFQVYDCLGRGTMIDGETTEVGISEVLLGAVMADIPVFLYPVSQTNSLGLGADFLELLFGVPPSGSFPESDGKGGPASPVVLDINALTETDIALLRELETGNASFDRGPDAVFIGDPCRGAGEEAIRNRFLARKRLFAVSVPPAPAQDALAFCVSREKEGGVHGFLGGFVERASRSMEVDKNCFSDIEARWPALFSEIKEFIRSDSDFSDSALEWFDLALTLFSSEFESGRQRETEELLYWMERFDMGDLIPISDIDRGTRIGHIEECLGGFESLLTVEDGLRIFKLAPFFSVLNRIKGAPAHPDPVEYCLEPPWAVSVRDIFIPFYLVLAERSQASAGDLEALLNRSVESYRVVIDSLSETLGLKGPVLEDTGASVKPRLIRLAVERGPGASGGVEAMIKFLLAGIRDILTLFRPEPDLMNRQILFLGTDLLTLAAFLKFYKKEINLMLNCLGHDISADDAIDGINRFFQEKKESSALFMPKVFQQKIPRILRRKF